MNEKEQMNISSSGEGIVKTNTLLSGYLVLGLAIILNLFLFLTTFIKGDKLPKNNFVNAPIFIFIVFCVFFVLGLFLSINYLKKTLAYRKKIIESQHTDSWSSVGNAFKYVDLIKTIFSIIVLVLFIGGTIFIVYKAGFVSFSNLGITARTYVYAGIFLVFFLIFCVFKKKMGGAFKNASRVPLYTIQKDGFVIDLNYVMIGKPNASKLTFKVFFKEIDEIKELSFIEARNYQRYTIGPNFELVARKVKEEISFIQGAIPRPSVYFMDPVSNFSNFVIRGPKIFYMMPFSNENNRELIGAFNAFKSGKKGSIRDVPTPPRPKNGAFKKSL